MDATNSSGEKRFELGLRAGFIDSAVECEPDARPQLVYNSKESGSNLLTVIKRQLANCESFDFCVAFVADSGLQPLVEILADLERRGVKGRFLTSTYLNFNSPAAFRKLLEYKNLEVRVYQGSMHAKGYLFEREGLSTVIVGSSNLTQTALTCNKEWNVLFRSYERGGVLQTVREEFKALWEDPSTERLSAGWIDEYEAYRTSTKPAARRLPTFRFEASMAVEFEGAVRQEIRPNKMQAQALEALDVLHRGDEPRALLVSATGTGKTYLSAFDVLAVKPRRVLFLVHRRRILEASMRSYARLLGDRYTYGMYSPGGRQQRCHLPVCHVLNHLQAS